MCARSSFRSGPSAACCHTHSSEPEANEDGDYLVSMMIVDLFRCVCAARQLTACSPSSCHSRRQTDRLGRSLPRRTARRRAFVWPSPLPASRQQTSKPASKLASKQTSKEASKQTSKQTLWVRAAQWPRLPSLAQAQAQAQAQPVGTDRCTHSLAPLSSTSASCCALPVRQRWPPDRFISQLILRSSLVCALWCGQAFALPSSAVS